MGFGIIALETWRDETKMDYISWPQVDRLVKNRGFLVNLETEVEPGPRSFPGVNRSAAFKHQNELVGFVTPADVPTDKLQRHLKEGCDHFLVPDLLFTVQDFALTSNGKIDQDTQGYRLSKKCRQDDG